MKKPKLLTLNKVNFYLKVSEKPILRDINLEINEGEFLILLGGNGSGKTSLIKLINQSLVPTEGEISLNQKLISKWKLNDYSKAIVSLAQNASESLFSEMTVIENCLIWEQRFRTKLITVRSKNEQNYYNNHLREYHASLPHRLNTQVERLSGGEKQALLLGLSAVRPPMLLLLDEHTAALDPHQERSIMQLTHNMIRKHKITTIMTTHNLDHALEYGDRVVALKEGNIVFSAEVEEKRKLSREDLLRLCY